MPINPRSTAVLAAAAILLLVAGHVTAVRLPLRGDLCSRTDFPVICRSIVKGQKNPNAATEAAIKELMARTRQAKAAAGKAKRGNSAMSTCYSNLDTALDNLDKALRNIKENDGFSLNINLSAALTDYVTCNDAIGGSPKNNIVAKSAGVLHQMADNCLALSTFVKQ